jgi:hypothetical protein
VARSSVSLKLTLMLTMTLRMATTSGGETTVVDYAAFFLIVHIVQDKNNLLKINIKKCNYFESSRIAGFVLS